MTTQKKSAWKNQINEDLVQIDLGNIKSLKQNEVMADKVDLSSLPQGMNIIDENTNKTEYDLLLVGRKMSNLLNNLYFRKRRARRASTNPSIRF